MKRLFSGIALLLALASASACNRTSAPGDGKLKFAVIPKGTSTVFWQSIHARAVQELGVASSGAGPLREDDRASQVSRWKTSCRGAFQASCSRPLMILPWQRPFRMPHEASSRPAACGIRNGHARAESSRGASTMPEMPRETKPSTSDTWEARSSRAADRARPCRAHFLAPPSLRRRGCSARTLRGPLGNYRDRGPT